MKNALERTCEEYFIQLLATNTLLAPMSMRHFDDQGQADIPGIIIEAVQGAHRLDGPKGHDVQVSVLYRSTTTDSVTNDNVADAISDTVFGATPGLTQAESDFTFLLLRDAMTGTRQNTHDTRKRQKTFTLIAKID